MSCILTSLQQHTRLASVSHENPTNLFGRLPSLFRRQFELTICNAAPKTLTLNQTIVYICCLYNVHTNDFAFRVDWVYLCDQEKKIEE